MSKPNGEPDLYILRSLDNDDMEVFSERPRTPAVGGDPSNWPRRYEVSVANINGGDSRVIERVNPLLTQEQRMFHQKMQDEGYVQEAEGVLTDIREYLLSGILDDLHDAEYKSAAEDAAVLAAVLAVEVWLLEQTPTFGR